MEDEKSIKGAKKHLINDHQPYNFEQPPHIQPQTKTPPLLLSTLDSIIDQAIKKIVVDMARETMAKQVHSEREALFEEYLDRCMHEFLLKKLVFGEQRSRTIRFK